MDGASCLLLYRDRGLGTAPGAQEPVVRPTAPVAMSERPCQGRGERRPQLRTSTSPGRDPNPDLSRRPRPRGLLRRKGGDGTHGGEAESPGPGAPRWSRRRSAAVRPSPAARVPPARLPAARRLPSWPCAPAHPSRGPRRSRSRTRPCGQRARAPSLPEGPGARVPDPAAGPLLGASAGRRPFAPAASPLPAARAGSRAAPRGLRSRPPSPLGLSLFSRRNAAQPSAPPPRPPPP